MSKNVVVETRVDAQRATDIARGGGALPAAGGSRGTRHTRGWP